MKFSLFNPWPVYGVARPDQWPVPPSLSDPAQTREGMDRGFELSLLADSVGFDYIGLAEHHYHPRQMSPNPLLSGAALARQLTHAGLAMVGCTLPLVNPIRAAEEIAVLDAMTGGKLIVGLFRGTPSEYMTYGTPPAETRDMFEEGVDLLVQAWTRPQPFSWLGRYYDYRVVSVWPRPVTTPHPPILVAAGSPSGAGYAARHRFKIGIAFVPPERAKALAHSYRDQAAAAGWSPTPEDVLYRCHILVADTDVEAQEIATRYRYGGGGPAFMVSDFGVRAELDRVMREAGSAPGGPGGGGPPKSSLHFVGSPDTVARQISAFADLTGVGLFDLLFNDFVLPFEHARRGVELFGAEVMPRLREQHRSSTDLRDVPVDGLRWEGAAAPERRPAAAIA